MPAYYQAPSSRILQPLTAYGSETVTIPSADDIAATLTAWGLPCASAGVDAAPQVLTYYFNLLNVKQRPQVKRHLAALSAVLHCRVTETETTRAHFALSAPRPERVTIPFRAALQNKDYNANRAPLTACIGYDSQNEPVRLDITKAPHLLIAGATGSGKSVCLNTLINSLLFRATPNDMRLLMVDTKRVELSAYENLPHLYAPIAKDGTEAVKIVRELVRILRERQAMMESRGVVDISQTEYPRILLVIDELADLVLMCKDEMNPLLITLAQLGRAAGIHLILATQRPTVDVVTGLLKANVPCRIALQTASIRDSMTILDHKGAEQLTGKGDALLKTPDRVEERRIQIAYINRTDIDSVAAWWKNNGVIQGD